MRKYKRSSLIIAIMLIAAMCVATTGISFGMTAKEAGEKKAEATKTYQEAEENAAKIMEEIDSTKAKIKDTESKIEKKQEEIKNQTNDLGKRLTAMYKTGTVGYVDVILNSKGIPELISNIGMVQKVLKNDQIILGALKDEQKKLEKMKDDLEKVNKELEVLEAEQKAIRDKFKAEAEEWEAKEKELEAQARAAAAAAVQRGSWGVDETIAHGGSTSGAYCWPTDSYYLTSEYGYRIHPITGQVDSFHNGIDLGARTGTPVYAIQDGMISRASWYYGYGNCIELDCGTGITALYGHLSGYNCSYGQYVTKGQVIGYVGSTGQSTGPHLHFTVYYTSNGNTFNPYNLY